MGFRDGRLLFCPPVTAVIPGMLVLFSGKTMARNSGMNERRCAVPLKRFGLKNRA